MYLICTQAKTTTEGSTVLLYLGAFILNKTLSRIFYAKTHMD
jgi:hypothetical protein